MTEPRERQNHETFERLLAGYFDVDLTKVEEERRAIIDEIRGTNS